MNIYPTFLYVKQHSITGIKYFGKTQQDPYTYNGSGNHRKLHIKKHGIEHIVTLWVSNPYIDSALISEYALAFSKEHNIAESTDWANLINENGLDGCPKGVSRSDETRAKISASMKGKPLSDKVKRKMSASRMGKTHSVETRAKISATMRSKLLK